MCQKKTLAGIWLDKRIAVYLSWGESLGMAVSLAQRDMHYTHGVMSTPDIQIGIVPIGWHHPALGTFGLDWVLAVEGEAR